jgi:hypothetical protein
LQALFAATPPRLRMVEPNVQATFGPRVGHGILSSWTTQWLRREAEAWPPAPSTPAPVPPSPSSAATRSCLCCGKAFALAAAGTAGSFRRLPAGYLRDAALS